MRKILISAALLSAAAISVPAAAQYQGPGRVGYGQPDFRGGGIEAQLRQLDERIRSGFQRGLLSRNEANRLSRDVARLQDRIRERARDGLSFRERRDIEERVQRLRERVQDELREGRDQRRDRRW